MAKNNGDPDVELVGCHGRKTVNKKKRCQQSATTSAVKEICQICGEYGLDNELWYRFTACGLRVHSKCRPS